MIKQEYDTIATWLLTSRSAIDLKDLLAGILQEYDEIKTEQKRKERKEMQLRMYIQERARRCEEPF